MGKTTNNIQAELPSGYQLISQQKIDMPEGMSRYI